MKILPVLIFGLLSLCVTSNISVAQNISSQPIQVTVPTSTPYAITAQDANSRVWQRTDYQMSPSGEVITNTHSVTEICSGLNHWAAQWVASSEQIDILPNGIAVATNGQHQAYFPGDIYQGQIELVTPDGQHLQSRPLALVYFDGTNTVVIAELTNSVGLVGNNQVTYPNAFTGFKVDLRYTYTKAGFSQDVILRTQPPTPESLGLNPDTARLQIMTEFFSAPQPAITSSALPTQAGISLDDESLGFGTMQMVPGRAFLMGQNAQDAGALVSKHWLIVNGRQVLIEEVPVDAILEGLAALPLTAMNSSSGKHSHTASKHLKLPPQRMAQNTSKSMLIARTDPPTKGFVLDYQALNSSLTNYTFQGDTTYYISGTVNLYGTNVIEGGTVLKYTNNVSLNINGLLNCQTGPYRPAILTAKDDNSVGETIPGSTGSPSGYYAATALWYNSPTTPIYLHDIRISYASTAVNVSGSGASLTHTIRHGQIHNANYAVFGAYNNGSTLAVQNVLAYNIGSAVFYNLSSSSATAFSALYCTMDHVSQLFSGTYPFIFLKQVNDSLLVFVTNSTAAYQGGNNGTNNSDATFQVAGAGAFYLATNSIYRNIGLTNIDSTLLAAFGQKTTYPPVLYSNVTVSINTTLNPQAQRDTNMPDLGYHYDPIDYLVDQYTITNATLVLTNGVAVAGYNDGDLIIEDGSSIVSIGSPLFPNWLVRYSSVQEQPISLGASAPSSALTVNPYHVSVPPVGQFRFTKFACPAGGGDHLYDYQNNWSYGSLLVQDCEFWSGANFFAGNTNTVAILKNNLFARSVFTANPFNATAISYLYVTNNLFWGVSSVLFGGPLHAAASTNWCVFNNDFDSCSSVGSTTVSITNGYNAYFNSTGYVYPTNATDIFTNIVLAYKTGPLGTFYQTNTSPLINKGSVTANLVGLYHYTVTTNLVSNFEIKETNSIVDIGYHYVATDANGIPIDTNGDGIPDYLEDANGNGLVNSGEIGWNITGDLGLRVLITRPRNGNILP